MDYLPFALPEIGEEEIAEVVDSLRSGWITTGPKAKKFELDFIEYLGDSNLNALSVNSATSGLHLALEALGVGPGDEVIVPSYTFTSTAEVVRYLGATPVFVDVDVDTFNITVKTIAPFITSKTKVIMPVHFAGLSCEMDSIIDLARKNDIKIVEDAAHAFPTLYNGKKIGTLESDVTVFSFYANKTMTTAEGGMLVTRSSSIAERCKVMRLHGISKDVFDRYSSKQPSWFYEVVSPGYKYNMPDISAAIGIHQLRKIDRFRMKRELLARRYFEKLNDLPLILPVISSFENHAWHLFPVRLNDTVNISRDDLIEKLSLEGIGCSVHFIPLHLHPYWRDEYKLDKLNFPNSQLCFEREVSLPLYTKMEIEDIDRVYSALTRILLNV